jgi:hypothetical protein
MYLQVVKQRDEHGRFQGTKLKVIAGTKAEVIELLGKNTDYIERSNLTSRLFKVQGDEPGKWSPRTPAMAAKLTDHIWTVKELPMTVPLLTVINTKRETISCPQSKIYSMIATLNA